MTFRIADTFTASLARLTTDEQKAAKATAFELQLDPSHPSMQFHRIADSKDKHFWSVRVNVDLRLIVHRSEGSMLLCYVDRHDTAYRWAERRKLDTHPVTGAAQLVEVRERVEEVVRRVVIQQERVTDDAAADRPLFAHLDGDDLLRYGIPPEWLDDVRAATESTLFELAEHLPAEAADALLTLATGEVPEVVVPAAPDTDPFTHPTALQRFRTVEGAEELERALAAPWEQWVVFLHPSQRDLVARDFDGPARVSGSAGTGKTVVALHRAVHLAERDENIRVLLATFSDTLAAHIASKLHLLLGNRPRIRERLDVTTLDALARRLHRARHGTAARIADSTTIRDLLVKGSEGQETPRFSEAFLMSEWEQVVDAHGLRTWEAYRDVARLGRKTRLPESARARAWQVFSAALDALSDRGLTTMATVYGALADEWGDSTHAPYDHVILDEAQDASAAQLRFLARLAGDRPNGLFFAGDLGQRIFQQPFSWLSVGVDVRGRARTLRVNYRTSYQIRTHADGLLDARIDDVDGEAQDRRGTISVFDGPEPRIELFPDAATERAAVAAWLAERAGAGTTPNRLGVFVRSRDELPRALDAIGSAGLEAVVLDDPARPDRVPRIGAVSVATMHKAKGLEFPVVAVMACDEDVLPLASRLDAAADMTELKEVHDTERHLLYVAATRARDELWVSAVEPGSEYLADLL